MNRHRCATCHADVPVGHRQRPPDIIKTSQPDGSRDVSSQLLTIKRANIDCMYMATNGSAFAPTLRQIRQFLPKDLPVLTETELSYPNFRNELKELATGAFSSPH